MEDYLNMYSGIFGLFTSPLFIIGSIILFVGGFAVISIIKYVSTINMIKKAIKEALREYDVEKHNKPLIQEPEKKEGLPQ